MEYKNRYNDNYTFTLQEDGSILWEGDFTYHRIGWPNVYKEAYEAYCKDVGSKGERPMHIDSFKEAVHESVYDENDNYAGSGPIAKKYGSLVYSDKDTIDMVDPSGGPYITTHQDLSWLGEEFKDLCVGGFKSILTGYKIFTYGKYDHLADTKIIGGIINTSE
jgi:hypothetical protein